LFVIGLPKDDFATGLLMSKFRHTLEKAKKILPEIIEAKIAVETQNPEGSRTHYEVRATVTTAKNQLVYTESGWDILKISDELCRKLEGELPKRDTNRQRESIRKKEVN
jgi:ribosome-associated translation inhibitor RaiA